MVTISLPESSGKLKRHQNRAKLVMGLTELTERCRQGLPSQVPELTKEVLKALAPAASGEKDVLISTKELACFYVRVTKDGHRSYCVQHRVFRRHTIGDVRVKSIRDALKRGRALLDAAHDGRNLLAEEQATKKKIETTAAMIVDQYLAEPSIRRLRSFNEKARYLRQLWLPMHGLPAETVTRHDLIPTLRRIASERGGRTANVAPNNLSAAFVHAMEHGWLRRDDNPCAHLPRWPEGKREHVLDLPELGTVYRLAPEVSSVYGAVVRLLVLLGCRRAEIGDLRWSEVDFGEAKITLPASRVKNGRPLVIPLAPPAFEIPKTQRRINGERVFPRFGWGRAKTRLDQLAKLDQTFVIHDLRRSFSTGCHEHLKADVHLVELAIGHVSGSKGGIAGHYDKSERLADRRRLFEQWSRLILRHAGGPMQPATVVAIQ
jgi:integrase